MLRAMRLNMEDEVWAEWIACCMEPIPKAVYDFLMARHHYAVKYNWDLPEAFPREPVDLNKMKSIY